MWRQLEGKARGRSQLHFPLLVSTNVLLSFLFLFFTFISSLIGKQKILQFDIEIYKWHDGSGLTIPHCFLWRGWFLIRGKEFTFVVGSNMAAVGPGTVIESHHVAWWSDLIRIYGV